MAGKRIAGPESAGASEQPDRSPASASADSEGRASYGPLAVRRLEKEDGRALIVYGRRPEGSER